MEQELTLLGWREWLALPDLELPQIAAKIDTGARTSCLHTFAIEPFQKNGQDWLRFGLHPVQDQTDIEIWREARVHDQREVSDSGGHRELRYVIQTTLQLGPQQWPIEMTLTSRDTMRFRMLLGRTAMNGRCLVDPQSSWLMGEPSRGEQQQTFLTWQNENALKPGA